MINQMVNPADDVCRSYIHATNLYEARLPLRALYAVEGPSRGFDGFDKCIVWGVLADDSLCCGWETDGEKKKYTLKVHRVRLASIKQ